jgi:hypothetical protein
MKPEMDKCNERFIAKAFYILKHNEEVLCEV